ncbi:MAG: GHKL domain-containing protein [Eisenbergiella massiliensis]
MDILAEPGFYCGEIRDYDCISILSNLLDNSLEAAEKCGDENRYVALHLFMDTDRNYAVIRLENGCTRMPVYDRGGFRTGKENKTRHGFGIKHVKELVAANKGLIDFEVQENRFTVTVCLPV